MGTHPIFESDFDCLTDMATSSLAREFRKINIEQYDEDFYVDDVITQDNCSPPDTNIINNLLSSGKQQDALKAALSSNPASSTNQKVKDDATETVIRVLTAHKTSQISPSLKTLNEEEKDLLMQYIYKAMSMGKYGSVCASLLTWHTTLAALSGTGCILRVLTDRRRL